MIKEMITDGSKLWVAHPGHCRCSQCQSGSTAVQYGSLKTSKSTIKVLKCYRCNKTREAGWKFCASCGSPLSGWILGK